MALTARLRPGWFLQKNFAKNIFSTRFERTLHSSVAELLKNDVKGIVTVKGWVKNIRKMKGVLFVDINDGSGSEKLQVVVPKEMKPENLGFGASVEASGIISLNSYNMKEIKAEHFQLIGACGDPKSGYPFAAKERYSDDYVRQYLHLRPRHPSFASILRLRDAAMRGLHNILGEMGYICVNTPILTSNDCEGAGEVFKVQPLNQEHLKTLRKHGVPSEEAYFNCEAFLTVSGQLQLEAAAIGLGKVYTFGPVFRAENSKSRLHLSEFYMLEAEIAFSSNLEDSIDLTEKLIKGVTSKLLKSRRSDLEFLSSYSQCDLLRLEGIANGPAFPRLTYDEAAKIIQKHEGEFTVKLLPGENLKKEHELFLSNYALKEMNQDLVFVTHWPADIKPFYMKQNENNQALAFDLLGPICGELCGGSVREPNVQVLEDRLLKIFGSKEALKNLDWYLDIRRNGNVPTSGFGIGFERLLQCVLGVPNIKDVLPFPRGPHNLKM
ncbi:probable asparagine--tRNA ligase, mitochondrial isoform X2 [Neocloeon triangulifer]|uniref:probable asparagine--tRNA ligase, mitochondrial isoform X2 n=1 Tax=Neocloeon triangulifer TaxID=2078957 RepID=UPI00286F31FE|nr:probable asparagine--tRNA ligase, mitochondrial isoform X2 [Neocloeon triangulifer]